jgi:predicted transcriptional regulator
VGGVQVSTSQGTQTLKGVPAPPHIINSFRTPELFINELATICPNFTPPKTPFLILADEAPTFFRRAKYAQDLIPLLIKLYDCKTSAPGTIGRGIENVEDPYGCGLFGVIPEVLVDLMPKEAAAGGFASRCVWVYSEDTSRCFAHPELEDGYNPNLFTDLIHDLTIISQLEGEMTLTKNAYSYFKRWYDGVRGEVAQTVDLRYMGYMNRKGDMVYKLAMLLALAESDRMKVNEHHFLQARILFEQLEPDLPKVYVGAAGRAPTLDNRDIVVKILHREGRWMQRQKLTKACYNNRISAAQLDDALEQLHAEGVIEWEEKGKALYYRIKQKP